METRNIEILAAIVDEYIRTGEPVGSKAVAGLLGNKVSAATIRNNMSFLEQLGYLEQPHTSAGRIPTFSGFRLYIEKIMPSGELPEVEVKRLEAYLENAKNNAADADGVIQNVITALAEVTQCAAVVTNFSPRFSLISKVQVVPTGKRLYVILLITSDGGIKNRACRLEFDLNKEQLNFFEEYLRENLEGIPLEELTDEHIERLATAMGTYVTAMMPLLEGLKDISEAVAKPNVNMSGEKNLLTCGELDRHEVVSFIEKKELTAKILDETFSDLSIVFSDENDGFLIGNSSMLVAKYRQNGKPAGSLGIVGPMRLDYAKIMPYLKFFTEKLTDLLTENNENIE